MTDDHDMEWRVKTLSACMMIPDDMGCSWHGAYVRVTELRRRYEAALGLLREALGSGERLPDELRLRIQWFMGGEKA